jgi:Fungalysin metallopeptidase (M36).
VVTSRNNALREPGLDPGPGPDTDLDSAELTKELRDLPIKEYDATQAPAGRLVGPWVQVQGGQPYVQVTAGRFELTRGMPGFEGLMAYAHIDRYQRYLQDTLGFKGAAAVNAEPQDLYAIPVQGYDNSFYQPGNDLMLLGAGGVDDAEDAEVILHEYGHAMQDAQVPGWGANAEGGAMGEGFGDFQSGSYYARTSGGFQDVCLMDWDSTTYSSANPPCIRRMDSTKVWPKDKANEVHDDGEIWETYLWRLRDHLGTTAVEKSDNSLRLVISSHELLTPNATFALAVAALRQAATTLGQPDWIAFIDSEARTSGFIK